MKDRFPLLYSHAVSTDASVACIMTDGLRGHLMPRLTAAARAELAEVQEFLQSVVLTEEDDRRTCPLSTDKQSLESGPIYRLMIRTLGDPPTDFYRFVWENRAPPQVQFFAWLLVQDRLQCRDNLHKKGIVDDPVCELCKAALETCTHLLLDCPLALQIWTRLGYITDRSTARTIWELKRPPSVPAKHSEFMVLLVCWHIWKHRNEVIFQQLPPSASRMITACKEDVKLWKFRLKTVDRPIAEVWCQALCSM